MPLKHDTAIITSGTPQTGEPRATCYRARVEPFLAKCRELWPGAQVVRPYMPSERWSAAMRGFIHQQQKFAHQRESSPADAGNVSDRKE